MRLLRIKEKTVLGAFGFVQFNCFKNTITVKKVTMEKNNFYVDTKEPFEGSDKVKKQLVSEIDVIRDTMMMVNMFMGEPFRLGAKMSQELESNKSKK
jgi:hypothetical protein